MFLKMAVKNWVGKIAFSLVAGVFAALCANAETDFNQVGKYASYRLQNMHFLNQEFSDDLSQNSLKTFLHTADSNKMFFTQEDVDRLKEKYGDELDDYLLGDQTMDVAVELYDFYASKVERRVEFALKLLEKNDFKFDRDEYIALSRSKVDWPKDEAELDKVWRDIVEERLLSEILRREMIAKRTAEQNKSDPSADEKAARDKLVLRYSCMLRNIKEYPGPEEKSKALLSAVARSFDPHSDYIGVYETEGIEALQIGIGALFEGEDDGAIRVTGIVVGGPADKSGELKLNDRIVGVDSANTGEMIDIMYMKPGKVFEMLEGEEGTMLRLKVESAESPTRVKFVTLERKKIEWKDAYAKGQIVEVKENGAKPVRLGILNLPSFYADDENHRCAADVKKILTRMVDEKIEGLLIDLRNNGGGSLEEVRRMTGFFIGAGPVVQVKDAKGDVEVLSSDSKEPIFSGRVVVLVNKASASASELFAAALQDYGRAVIVGNQSTFGKGTVQQVGDNIGRFMPRSGASRAGFLKITVKKFYRVSGGSTQLKGVESDIVLPSLTSVFEIGESFLDYAMPYDQIDPAKGYQKDSWIGEILPGLKERSEKRVAADVDLRILQEKIDRLKKRFAENRISLNRDERVKEDTQNQNRLKSINKGRKVRFAKMAKNDAKRYKFYRLTLEDVDKPGLVPADPKKDHALFMKRADYFADKLDSVPDYPSGLDPQLRETLKILSDMVSFNKGK